MCNLYDIGRALRHRSRNDWDEAVARALKDSRKAFGIRKTDPGLVLTHADSENPPIAQLMRWGFERDFNTAINNARSDRLDGMWSAPWEARQRCLIPIATFYEWTGPTGSKQTFAFQPGNEENFIWAAGLWEPAPPQASFSDHCYSMLTTQALGVIASVHDRMPAILVPDQFEEFFTAPNPRHLLSTHQGDLHQFRCENPLKAAGHHEGPVPQTMLPGFE